MRKFYFTALTIVSLAAVIFTIPSVGLIAIIFTFGLAALLIIPLPYLLIGLWIAFPTVLYWHEPSLRLRLSIVSALLAALFVGFVMLAPPLLADKALNQDLASRGDVVAAPANFVKPIGVEIHRRVDRNHNLYIRGGKSGAFHGTQPCFELCERLLTGGDVAWIRLIMTNDTYRNIRVKTNVLILPGTSETCREVNSDFPPGVRCALFAPNHEIPADLTIVLDEDQTKWRASSFAPYQPMGYRTAVAYTGSNTEAPVLFQLSQLFHNRPTGWISYDIGLLGSGRSVGGVQFVRARSASDPIDLVDAFETLGLALGSARQLLPKSPDTERNVFIAPPPDAQDAAYAASLVAIGPEGRRSNSLAHVVNNWHGRLSRRVKLSRADRAIFCATLAYNPYQKLFWDDQVIIKHSIICP